MGNHKFSVIVWEPGLIIGHTYTDVRRLEVKEGCLLLFWDDNAHAGIPLARISRWEMRNA